MDLECIMLSKVTQSQKKKTVMFSFIWLITYSLCVYVHMQANVHVDIIQHIERRKVKGKYQVMRKE